MERRDENYLYYKASEYTDRHLRSTFLRVVLSDLYSSGLAFKVLRTEIDRRNRNRGFDMLAVENWK